MEGTYPGASGLAPDPPPVLGRIEQSNPEAARHMKVCVVLLGWRRRLRAGPPIPLEVTLRRIPCKIMIRPLRILRYCGAEWSPSMT